MRELKAEKAESSRLKVNSTTHIQLTTYNLQQTTYTFHNSQQTIYSFDRDLSKRLSASVCVSLRLNNLEPGNNAMRVKTEHIKFLKRSIKKYLPDAAIYLIGSRADDGLKGGDIDILVIDEKAQYAPRRTRRVTKKKKYIFPITPSCPSW